MDKKAVIFDIDGLMVNTEVYYTKSWQMGLNKYGYDISDEEVASYSGLNWRIVGKKIAERYQDEVLAENVIAERERILNEVIEAGKIELKPHIKEVLTYLKEKGYRLAVASSGKKARASRILEILGLLPYFEFCIYGDDVKKNKPYPDCYLEALHRLNIAADEAVAVEDSLTGAKAATNANIEVIVIPDSNLHHEYSKEELSDIHCLVQAPDLSVIKEVL